MRKYLITYRGKSRTILASDALAARRLGTRWLHSLMDMPEPGFSSLNVAVVDVEASGHGAFETAWLAQYHDCYHCTLAEQCPRSGTCLFREFQHREAARPTADADTDALYRAITGKEPKCNPKGWQEVDGVVLPSVDTWADLDHDLAYAEHCHRGGR